jgi:hypothetical protein
VVVAADIADQATLTGGVFVDRRFGDDDAFHRVRPVMALALRTGRSRITFGTLGTPRPAPGPDRHGPHGLLPPIQADRLALERPYEAGLQWTYTAPRVKQDAWLNWHRLNTRTGREAFDAGSVGRVDLRGRAALGFHAHVVHHGGQQHANGPVADSWVIAPGLVIDPPIAAAWRPTFETYVLVSRHVPDREQPLRSTSGAAVFTRAALEYAGWRGHLIVWRGNDFIKEEGDPNYGGLRRDGTRFRKVRDYAELGVARTAHPVPALAVEGSARLHRVEDHYEYSYRLLATVGLSWRVR